MHGCSFSSATSSDSSNCAAVPSSRGMVSKHMGKLDWLPGGLIHAAAFCAPDFHISPRLKETLCRLNQLDLNSMQLPPDISATFLSKSCRSNSNDRYDIIDMTLTSSRLQYGLKDSGCTICCRDLSLSFSACCDDRCALSLLPSTHHMDAAQNGASLARALSSMALSSGSLPASANQPASSHAMASQDSFVNGSSNNAAARCQEPSCPPNILKLSVKGCSRISMQALETLSAVGSLSRLRALNISFLQSAAIMPFSELTAIFRSAGECLESLKMDGCRVTPSILQQLGLCCPNLRTLSAIGCRGLTLDSLTTLAGKCQHITHLGFGGNMFIWSCSGTALSAFGHLRSLKIARQNALTDSQIMPLLHANQHTLTDVHLAGCSSLTDDIIQVRCMICQLVLSGIVTGPDLMNLAGRSSWCEQADTGKLRPHHRQGISSLSPKLTDPSTSRLPGCDLGESEGEIAVTLPIGYDVECIGRLLT